MRTGIIEAQHRHRQACADTDDHIRRMRFHRPLFPFRAGFSYSSEGFVVVGRIIAERSGMSWADFARGALWQPLGMERTNVDHRAAREDGNSATPHAFVQGRLRPIPPFRGSTKTTSRPRPAA